MSGSPIAQVREHCSKFGEKFFEENGKKITLITFGEAAKKYTYHKEYDFQKHINSLRGSAPGADTNFAPPLRELKNTIVEEGIKELLVVFLTDGLNADNPQTLVASRELENVLDGLLSKFNVIGFGTHFNVQILESLVKGGSQPGVISSNVDEAFSKILEKFEATPTAKFKIPGQATIDVPMTDSNYSSVTFETSVILDLND
jgi:hypothetical protein